MVGAREGARERRTREAARRVSIESIDRFVHRRASSVVETDVGGSIVEHFTPSAGFSARIPRPARVADLTLERARVERRASTREKNARGNIRDTVSRVERVERVVADVVARVVARARVDVTAPSRAGARARNRSRQKVHF